MSNKKLIVALCLFILISIASTGYIVYDKLYTKEEINETLDTTIDNEPENNIVVNETNEEEFSLSLKEANDLLTDLKEYYDSNNVLIPYKSLGELTNNDLLNIALSKLCETKGLTTCNNLNSFSKEELENAFKNTILGNLTIEHEDIIEIGCGIVAYKYDKSTGTYTYNDVHWHGSNGGIWIIPNITNYYYENGTYILEEEVVYVLYNGIGYVYENYYKTYEDIYEDYSKTFGYFSDCVGCWGNNEITNNYHDILYSSTQLTKITYKFNKIDNQIYLTDYKVS